MTKEEIAALAGVSVVSAADGAETGRALVLAVQTAADRIEAAEAMARVMGDAAQVAGLAAWSREDPGAWAGCLAALRAVRGMSAEVRALDKLVGRAAAPVRVARGREDHDAPDGVPDGWQVPHGWHMDGAGIFAAQSTEVGEELVRVTTAPMWVVGRMVDVDSGKHAVELAWEAWDGGLSRVVVDGARAADARAIVALADHGAPVHSANAREVVRFLAAAMAANADLLPVQRTAQRMGWMAGGFLLGERWIGEPDQRVTLRVDDGAAQVAASVAPRGSFEGWLPVLSVIAPHPSPWVALYMSAASVLLHPLDAHEGYTVDWSGETSQGKTSSLRLAASLWGEPSPRGLLQSWSLTLSRAEGIAALLAHVPWFLDDTKQARAGDMVASILYMQAFGQGKGRAKVDGLRASASWLNGLGSTGEQSAISFTQDAGARARTLCLVGSPLTTREGADRVNSICLDHYGHVGPMVVQAVQAIGVRKLKAAWKKLHAEWVARLSPHGAVAGRLAALCTHLDVAAWVLHEHMGLPLPTCDVFGYVERAAIRGGEDSDRPAEALRALYELAMSQTDRLWSEGAEQPHGQWIGSWPRDPLWTYLALRPTWVREQLDRLGFDAGVEDRWHERGWLDRPATGKHRGMPTTMGESRPRLLRFRRDGLVACGAVGDDS